MSTMKYLFSSFLFIVFVTIVAAKTQEEKKAMFLGVVMNCSSDLNIPIPEGRLEKKQCPEDDDMKCLLDCAMERFGMVVDGQFSLAGAKQAIEFGVDDPEMKKKAIDVVEHCEKSIGMVSGKCSAGTAICECVMAAGLFSAQ